MTSTTNQIAPDHDQDLLAMVEAGRAALAAGNLTEARTAFEAVVFAFPDEAVGHNNLGAFYMGLGDHAAAEAAFQRVVDLLPGNANCLFNLGTAQFHQEHYEAAATTFAGAHTGDPDDPETLNNLGAARFQAGRIAEARKDLEAALQLQPNYPSAVINLSDLEYAAGRLDRAIGLCQAYLDHHQDGAVSRQLLTLVDLASQRPAESEVSGRTDPPPDTDEPRADAATP